MNGSIFMCFIIFATTAGIKIENDENERYCFQFTWPGALIDCNDENGIKIENITCEDKKKCKALQDISIPCASPIVIQEKHPNFSEIWKESIENKHKYACRLQKGYSCMKYTYSFNNALTKATYFCGKMIENNQSAVQDGCFNQQIGGYEVETCACQSTGNEMPCNSSTELNYSLVFFLSILFLLALF